jgi:hypothetical protein
MAGTTSRLSLPYPAATDDVSVFPPVSLSQMTTLDAAVLEDSGTIADRPSAATIGRAYYATDTRQWHLDTGSSWIPLGLILTSVTSSATVANGQMVQVNAGSDVVITLPSPTLNTIVGVRNGVGISSLMVEASTGNIFGLGLGGSGALSIPVGAVSAAGTVNGIVGATVIMVGDGSNFNIIAGAQDTGWATQINGTGITGTLQTRQIGDRVWLQGSVSYGSSATSFTTFGPPGYFTPSHNRGVPISTNLAGGANAPAALLGEVTTGGLFTPLASFASFPVTIYFDGASFGI